MDKCAETGHIMEEFDEQTCVHLWAEAFCISEDFTDIEPNGEVCERCGEIRRELS